MYTFFNQIKDIAFLDKLKMRYAKFADSHKQIINDICSKFKTLRLGAKRSRPPCLNSWQITINNILQLAQHLREDCNIRSLLTRYLNQELENFFLW